jgi:ArsR family transcriptional regulator
LAPVESVPDQMRFGTIVHQPSLEVVRTSCYSSFLIVRFRNMMLTPLSIGAPSSSNPDSGCRRMKDSQTDWLWQDRAKLLRAMAHPVRLMILETLCERPKCVKEINSLIPLVQAHLSQHITALRRAKLIDRHVSGSLRCYYVVRPTLVRPMMRLLSQEHLVRPQDRRAVVRAASRR